MFHRSATARNLGNAAVITQAVKANAEKKAGGAITAGKTAAPKAVDKPKAKPTA